MQKILLISDNPIGVSNRGAEANDKIIYDSLECDFLTCDSFNQKLPIYDKYIVSNFYGMSEEAKEFLTDKKYVHISHDFLFTPSRNPFNFENGIVPDDCKINEKFFSNAEVIYTQSCLQMKIFQKNNIIGNYKNIGGNLWSDDDINFMLSRNNSCKKPVSAILGDELKGSAESIKLCKMLNMPFEIFNNISYYQFLDKLSKYSVMTFIPFIPETFSRIVIECKLMGVLPIVNELIGAIYEELYKLNGEDLAEKLVEIRTNLLKELKNE